MRRSKQQALSWTAVGALLIGVTGYTLFLVPDDREIVQRLIQDQSFAHARERIKEMNSQVTNAEEGEIVQRLEVQLATAEALAGGGSLTPEMTQRLLDDLFNADPSETETSWILQGLELSKLLPGPESVTTEHFTDFSLTRQARVRESLVGIALGQAQPAVAAEWHQALMGDAPSDASVTEMVRLWQQVGRPDKAIATIERLRSGVQWDLQRIDLYLAASRPVEALEVAQATAMKNPEVLNGALPPLRLMQIARFADRYEAILPILAEYLSTHPEDTQLRQSLIQSYLAAGQISMAKALLEEQIERNPSQQGRKLLAQIDEWTGEQADAFDLYLLLAAEGDSGAIDRLLALNPGIMRSRDLVKILQGLPGEQLNRNQREQLVKLQIDLGEHAQAEKSLQALILESENSFELYKLLGVLRRGQFDLAGARDAFTKALKLRPDDLEVLRDRARVHSRLRKFEAAKEDYARAYEISGERADLTQVMTLSRLLGNWDAFYAALAAGVDTKGLSAASDYIDLHNYYVAIQNDEAAESTLIQGIRALPENPNLPTALLYYYSNLEKYNRALACFEKYPSLNEQASLEPLRLYLLIRAGRLSEAEQYLATLPESWKRDTELLAMAANLYESLGKNKQAEALYYQAYQINPNDPEVALRWASVLFSRGEFSKSTAILQPFLADPSPDVLRRAAELFAGANQPAMAEEQMIRMVKLSMPMTAEDWGLLGDIRLSRGDLKGSRQAYRFASIELIRGNAQPSNL